VPSQCVLGDGLGTGTVDCKGRGAATGTTGNCGCACETGFEGEQCQINIDDCAGNPCQNNGFCQDKIAAFACTCAEGFVGAKCETNVNVSFIVLGFMWFCVLFFFFILKLKWLSLFLSLFPLYSPLFPSILVKLYDHVDRIVRKVPA
jgi:hypothetical protein